METLRRAALPWGPVSLAFFGVAFARVWLSLIFVEPAAALGAAPFPHDVFDLGFVVASIAAVLAARRLVPLADKPWAYVAVLAAMLAVSGVFCAGLVGGGAVPCWLLLAASVAGGAAYAAYLLLDAEVLAGVSLLRIVLYLSGTRVLSSAVLWLLDGADVPRTAFVLALFPAVAVLLVRVAYNSLPQADRQPRHWPRRYAFPWKLAALVAVFSFAYGLRQATLVSAGAGQHASVATGLAMGTIFLGAYFFSDRVDVTKLCRVPLPVMLCGLLLVPAEGLLGQTVSSYLVSMGYTLATFSIGILVYDMSKRTGVAVLPLVAAMNALQGFIVLGNCASRALDAAFGDAQAADMAASLLVGALLVVLFFLLFSERELAQRWGIKVLGVPTLGDEANEVDRLAVRCDELVRTFGLTPREDEVLRELARRKDAQAIAQNLLIAPGTLKAHTRHIYEKMGIHTRAELHDLLGLGDSED